MQNLIKAEFMRIRKDKTSLIGLIVVLGLTVVNALITILFQKVFSNESMPPVMLDGITSLQMAFLNGNTTFIMVIISAILVVKEFNQHTIRQKIIYGHSRRNIYLSTLLVVLVYSIIVLVISALLNMALMSAAFGFSNSSVDHSFNLIFYSIGIGILFYLANIVFSSFVSFFMKSTGASIAIIIGVSFLFSILAVSLTPFMKDNSFVTFFNKINPNYMITLILQTDKVVIEDMLYAVISSLSYISLMTVGGIYLFQKSDIK